MRSQQRSTAETWSRAPWAPQAMGFAIALGLLLGGCGNGGGPGFAFEPAAVSDAKNAWLPGEQACVLTWSERPVARVVNFSDPELCGRFVKARGPNYLRVPRPGEGSARY